MNESRLAAELRAALPDLGLQMAVAAQFVLDRSEDVVSCSMRELARRAGVPPVTFVRLAQRLGLPSYTALRELVVEEVLGHRGIGISAVTRNMDSAKAIARGATTADGTLRYAERFFAAEHHLLDRALMGLSEARLDKAAALLARGPRIFVVARRTAFTVAYIFAYAMRKARPNVVLLDDVGGAPEAALEDAQPGDVLLVVTFAPFSRATHAIGELAVGRGMTLIVIADTEIVPIGQHAGDLLFIAPAVSEAFPESSLAAMAIANLLTALTVAKLGEPAMRRIRDNENRLVEGGEYILARKRSRRR